MMAAKARLALLKSPPIAVESFGLYSSFLGSEQAYYRLEADYPLLPPPLR